MKHILLAAAFVSLSAFSAFATSEEICFEDVPIPASLSCAGNDSESADFSSGCSNTPATTKKVEVPCPDDGRWVNVTAATYRVTIKGTRTNRPTSIPGTSHAEVCAGAGLKPASLDGNVCAAGERRPMIGGRWEGINYKYGKKGDGNKSDGGDRPQFIIFGQTCSNGGRDEGDRCVGETVPYVVNNFCYDSWTKVKNYTKQDAVVAWYCE